jgi:ABC-2 type transport system ATP-binding protein
VIGAHDTPAIEARSLAKTYSPDVQALAGVDLTVKAGTIHGLLGPNGAGKSTIVKILTTLSRPTSGQAAVAGIDVVRRPADVRRQIGYVGQKSAVDPDATGRENLQLQGRIFGMSKSELGARAVELLERYQLTDAADRLVKTWSGGMARKLDVAMGLIHRPQVLFLDEPTTGLDPEARAELWSDIQGLTQRDGLTILLTTHYLEEADRLAAQVAIIDHGRIVAHGTPEQLKAELHGDAVVVELADNHVNGRGPAALERVPGLGKPIVEGRTLRARADHGASAVPAVLAALDGAGIAVASVTVARPSLDDVYLRHTGRSYAQSEKEDIK